MKPVNLKHPKTGGKVNIQTDAVGAVPPGVVLDFAGDTPPDGYHICDGTLYNKDTYAALFAAIGYKYGGSGDNFAVPNFADKFVKGKGAEAIGANGGSNSTHNHSVTSNVTVGDHSSLTLNSSLGTITLNHSHEWYESDILVTGSANGYTWDGYGNKISIPTVNNANGATFIPITIGSGQKLTNGTYPYLWTTKSLTDYNASHAHTFSQNITSHSVTNNAVTSGNSSLDNQPSYIVMNKIIKY